GLGKCKQRADLLDAAERPAVRQREAHARASGSMRPSRHGAPRVRPFAARVAQAARLARRPFRETRALALLDFLAIFLRERFAAGALNAGNAAAALSTSPPTVVRAVPRARFHVVVARAIDDSRLRPKTRVACDSPADPSLPTHRDMQPADI